jgi:predicted GNAT family N-acyltransferase
MRVRPVTNAAELDACLALRRAVFIEEQGVAEALELDGEDAHCQHFIAIDDDTDDAVVGTARLRFTDAGAKVQRVAVAAAHRRRGVGRIVMDAVVIEARRQHAFRVVLSSQVAAIPFYERLGFVASGPIYDDAGIPHRDMALSLGPCRDM